KLNQQESLKPIYSHSGEHIGPLDGTGYRVPTEAEWEYACRAGTITTWITGDDKGLAESVAWTKENSGGTTHPVGGLQGNPFGLYDVHGNVWEWCEDRHDRHRYFWRRSEVTIDPRHIEPGTARVQRGGDWSFDAVVSQSGFRHSHDTKLALFLSGFRVAISVEAVKQALQSAPAASTSSTWHGWPAEAPKPAIAPFDAAQAKKHQEEWAAYLKVPVEYTNSLGMKFRLIPPGEFLMGSTDGEIQSLLKDVERFLPQSVAELPESVLNEWQNQTRSERPQHRVILTQPIYVATYETTQAQYEKVVGTNPSYFSKTGPEQQYVERVHGLDTSGHPVEGVTWVEAAEFCAKLNQYEALKLVDSRSGETVTRLTGGGYRLPTEAEWEFACRAGTTTRFWIGETEEELARAAWFGKNSGNRTHNVGELMANPLGLFDVHGNAWEWVEDAWDATYFQKFTDEPAVNPTGAPSTSPAKILRGGDNYFASDRCRCSHRFAMDRTARYGNQGFRVALTVETVRKMTKREPPQGPLRSSWHGWPADAPKPAIAPFDTAQAKKHQEEWAAYLKVPVEYTNSLGMKFRLIPPGEFLMGSTLNEIEAALKDVGEDPHWQECVKSEGPQHRVTLTQPLYLGVKEVTQGEYETIASNNPSYFGPAGAGKDQLAGQKTTVYPVESVSWTDAARFCVKLSQHERLDPLYAERDESFELSTGIGYRLPTEAEWEFACRSGTASRYSAGDSTSDLEQVGWFDRNSELRSHPGGELAANPFGLVDMHGNVWEWMQDGWDPTWYSQHQQTKLVNPLCPFSEGTPRVLRGGNWFYKEGFCRSSNRNAVGPAFTEKFLGFRVTLSADAVRKASK
ncbi:MAG TPA: formylglycine-generating enzyme family protein, partial [Planctomycetaceae bacterium]|nr:formylglycine-generating enzyme family protein [Planctomycetaceae bacterium]